MIRNGGGTGGDSCSGTTAAAGAMGGAVGGNDGCIYPDEVIMEKGVAFNVRVRSFLQAVHVRTQRIKIVLILCLNTLILCMASY